MVEPKYLIRVCGNANREVYSIHNIKYALLCVCDRNFTDEVEKVKSNLDTNILPEATKLKEDIEDLSGPIKRQR